MTIDASFWDKIARKYAASPIKNMEGYHKTLDRTRHYLTETDQVLEIGCGTGSTALKLADTVESYLATDISSEMIVIAEDKLVQSPRDKLTFEKTSLADINVAPQSLDAVLAYSLLHLVEDLPATLLRSYSLLKSGGVVISKTPCLNDGWKTGLFKALIPIMTLFGKAPKNVLFFSKAELRHSFVDAGFEIEEHADDHGDPMAYFIVGRKP